MVPGDDEETNYTTTENPEDFKVIRHRGGFAVVNETEVSSTATPDWICNPRSDPPIDFDNRHERRKKAALAKRKRKGKNENYRFYWEGRKR